MRLYQYEVKGEGSTVGWSRKLWSEGAGELSGIPSVGGKSVDIRRKTSGGGGLLDSN